MPLIKNGQLADDPWRLIADDAPLPAQGPIIASLARWQRERAELTAREDRVGVRLTPKEQPSAIAADLRWLSLVALEFPNFRDGRAYSSARLLRERFGFEGEIRAVGNVLRDQFLFMLRCGFDAFEVNDLATAAAWTEAVTEISTFYQPAADGRRSVFQLRQQRQPNP